jgi:hypothetical protein
LAPLAISRRRNQEKKMSSKGVIRLFQIKAGDTDTNHARGYVVNPTGRRNDASHMTEEASWAFLFGACYGECRSGPFIKDGR